jgi:fumarate hydratase subunit alpha
VREVTCDEIIAATRQLCIDANYDLGEDVLRAFAAARASEPSPLGRDVLDQLLKNAEIAHTERVPMCQDTGLAVVFVELGQDVHLVGGHFQEAIHEGVRQGYDQGYLRKSSVNPPYGERANTGDNTPAIIHTDIVPGDRVRITVAPKGGGSENMSFLNMMTPSAGRQGIIDFVTDCVDRAGAKPCPPIIVGVGIGGTVDKVTQLAKRALLRPLGEPNPDPGHAALEQDILERVNRLGIGPMGLGGRTTALAVHVETHPCHIASMPVAVNMQCHAARHKTAII